MRVVVTRPIPPPALDVLSPHADLWVSGEDRPLATAELHAAIAGADAVVTLLHDTVDAAFLDAAGPDLRIVANVAVGVDNIDVEACRARGVIATNTPGVLTDATADLTLALILMATRRLGEAERLVRRGERWSWSMTFHLGRGLRGKRLGIVGLGQIGTAVARRCHTLGMEIVYTGRRRAEPELEVALEAHFVTFDALLETSDVVTLHCPLTPETRHLIDAAALRAMKTSAFLVNTTRGPVVDEAALADALRHGVIAGAGLDVFEQEPEVHPGLLELENAVLLPHLGSATVETRGEMALLAARNVVAVLGGGPPLTPVT